METEDLCCGEVTSPERFSDFGSLKVVNQIRRDAGTEIIRAIALNKMKRQNPTSMCVPDCGTVMKIGF
jgi:hypothetical protein